MPTNIPIQLIPEEKMKKSGETKPLIPIISESQIKSKPLHIQIIPSKGVTEFYVKKRVVSGARPIIPTGNTCCTNVCTVINKKVKNMEDDLRLREDELSSISEGLILETVKVIVPKKGEIKKGEIRKPGRKIETEEVEKERRISVAYSQSRLKLKKQVFAIKNQLEALSNIRYEMLENGSCRCIEEVKFPERKLP